MNAEQINYFKAQLETKLAEIEKTTDAIKADLLNISEVQANALLDEFDHAQEENILSTRLEVHEQQLLLKGRVKTALNKLAKGTFGQCDGCESMIDIKRLTAQPFSNYCMPCQRDAESRGVYRPFERSLGVFESLGFVNETSTDSFLFKKMKNGESS
jgi:DnaK suppressor protein